ncbi:restriction endonuclease subunit S [Bacillus sp. FJAT-29953]|uniref:Restriction endonuclease subunit S n=1 Tax=Neobacillus rhizophilus TaxID=2833579 RepID=A0A942U2P6_9BACI|nr:restriction endonuclease subunit S [Neobacillus rhizophilus]MBU8919467.1 restriction endonuclease subunit S [Bacillus sp. FJAT-29953]
METNGLLQQQGGSRTYMYFSKLIEFESEFPIIEEQQRIAEFIKILDKKIQKEILKHQLVNQKQAFMQQMFI